MRFLTEGTTHARRPQQDQMQCRFWYFNRRRTPISPGARRRSDALSEVVEFLGLPNPYWRRADRMTTSAMAAGTLSVYADTLGRARR